MMCYRDMTFCNAKCQNKECHRQITDKVIEGGTKWWGSTDFPIAISDFSIDCKEYQSDDAK
jgi:hypothetical protein